jgi:hypothetical protein
MNTTLPDTLPTQEEMEAASSLFVDLELKR